MSYILIFTNESQQDLREGFTWYEEKRVGLGIDFMLAIEATIRTIERNPFTYSQAPTTIPNIRRAVVFKFSYLIFTRLSNNLLSFYRLLVQNKIRLFGKRGLEMCKSLITGSNIQKISRATEG